MRKLIPVTLALLFLAASCGDETTNIYNPTYNSSDSDNSGIYGRVLPAQAGVTVAAWQTRLVGAATTDAGGYFTIHDLPPGTYEVVFTRPDGHEYRLSEIVVDMSAYRNLFNIQIDVAWPITSYFPAHGATDVFTQSYIWLKSEELLDMPSLINAVTIDPSLDGTWQQQGTTYVFETSGGMDLATTYTVTVDPGLRTAAGEEWDHTLEYTFHTAPLDLDRIRIYNYHGPCGRPLAPYAPVYAALRFNAAVDPIALDDAATFSPSMVGFWYPSVYNDNSNWQEYFFFPTEDVTVIPGQIVSLTVDGTIPLVGSHALGNDVSYSIPVGPVAVTDISPRIGSREVSETTSPNIRFNTPMEHSSTQAAISFTTLDGDPVAGSFDWHESNEIVRFSTYPVPLLAGETYVLRISTAATSMGGARLEHADSTFFTVRNY